MLFGLFVFANSVFFTIWTLFVFANTVSKLFEHYLYLQIDFCSAQIVFDAGFCGFLGFFAVFLVNFGMKTLKIIEL